MNNPAYKIVDPMKSLPTVTPAIWYKFVISIQYIVSLGQLLLQKVKEFRKNSLIESLSS